MELDLAGCICFTPEGYEKNEEKVYYIYIEVILQRVMGNHVQEEEYPYRFDSYNFCFMKLYMIIVVGKKIIKDCIKTTTFK